MSAKREKVGRAFPLTIGVQEATKDIARDEEKCRSVGAKMEERDQDVDDEIFTILRVFISSIAWSLDLESRSTTRDG